MLDMLLVLVMALRCLAAAPALQQAQQRGPVHGQLGGGQLRGVSLGREWRQGTLAGRCAMAQEGILVPGPLDPRK